MATSGPKPKSLTSSSENDMFGSSINLWRIELNPLIFMCGMYVKVKEQVKVN